MDEKDAVAETVELDKDLFDREDFRAIEDEASRLSTYDKEEHNNKCTK